MADGPLRVVVHGATGRMGREVVRAVGDDDELSLAGMVSRSAPPVPVAGVPHGTDLGRLLDETGPGVVVDFSNRDAALAAARESLGRSAPFVTGTSGLTPEDAAEIDGMARAAGTGAFIGPNFSLGATVLLRLAAMASRHFESVEIIERHHAGKADAPSGSALATARAMAEARGGVPFAHAEPPVANLEGTRGGELGGVAIHAVRLPGLMAHQEVVFGGPGETLTLRHDTIDRACYMPGVMLAVKAVAGVTGLVQGLESLLGLE